MPLVDPGCEQPGPPLVFFLGDHLDGRIAVRERLPTRRPGMTIALIVHVDDDLAHGLSVTHMAGQAQRMVR